MVAPHGCFGGCGVFFIWDIASPGALIADSIEKWYNQKQFRNPKTAVNMTISYLTMKIWTKFVVR